MKNLIMADLKVLGNRIWRIPLGFAAGCFVFSLLTGFSDKDYTSLVYFINLFLLPVIMLFELLREEQKNKSEMMILTMPVDKSQFVYARFIVAIFFIILGIVAISTTLFARSIVNGDSISRIYADPDQWYFYTCVMCFTIFFSISFYYYTEKLYLSLFTSTLGMILLLFLLLWTSESFLLPENSCWSPEFDLFLYPLRLIYLIGVLLLSHFTIKTIFKQIPAKFYLNWWFFIITAVVTIYLLNLFTILFFEYRVIADAGLKTVIKNGTLTYEQLDWSKAIENFYPSLTIYLTTAVILLISLGILFYKNEDNKFKCFTLLSLIPLIAMSLPEIYYLFFKSFLKLDVKYGEDIFYTVTIGKILFIPLCLFGFAKLTIKILNSKNVY